MKHLRRSHTSDSDEHQRFSSSSSSSDESSISTPKITTVISPSVPLRLNAANVEITLQDISNIFKKYHISLEPHNINHYIIATTHKSYCSQRISAAFAAAAAGDPTALNKKTYITPPGVVDLKPFNNEIYEFVGDKLIDCAVTLYIRKFSHLGEGKLTTLRSNIVNNNHLGKLSEDVGLYKWFLISADLEKYNERHNKSLLGSLFEAFTCAIYEDQEEIAPGSGIPAIFKFIHTILDKHVNINNLLSTNNNYKDIITRVFYHFYAIPAAYIDVKIEGPIHARKFTLGIRVLPPDVLSRIRIELRDYLNILVAPIFSRVQDNVIKLREEFENHNIFPCLQDEINIETDNRSVIMEKLVKNYGRLFESGMVMCYQVYGDKKMGSQLLAKQMISVMGRICGRIGRLEELQAVIDRRTPPAVVTSTVDEK